MRGAVFFTSKYGSTGQYARWIGEATGLPVFDIRADAADPADYDFLILASPVYYYRVTIGKWVRRNLAAFAGKPVVLVTVSGAPPGEKLDGWVGNSLPVEFVSSMKHVALQGRQDPKDLTWFDWLMLRIGSLTTTDPKVRGDELRGFDKMDKAGIEPVVTLAGDLQSDWDNGMSGR